MVFSTGGWVDWLNYHHLFYLLDDYQIRKICSLALAR